MKEALKTAAEALRIVYAEDAHVGNLSFMAHDALDSAIAAVEACLAQPEPEPVAWCVERVAPGMRDNGVRIGPWWRREDADAWADYEHKVVALYAGSAPTQSASPFAPCGRSAGTCGISSQTCGRDGCEADVVPADKLPKSQELLDWSAPVVAGTAQLAAVTAERDQLRAEVERLRSQRAPLTSQQIDDLMPTQQDGRWSEFDLLWMARSTERAHGICD